METILIVDDEQDLREILGFNLEQAGYRCLYANDGIPALEILQSGENVDLVLLDIMMSKMSGFELAERLQKDTYNGQIPPIIFLTALGSESDLLHAFKLGADDYITKPFSTNEVLARVSAVLRRSTPSVSIPIYTEEDIQFDDAKKEIRLNGQLLSLTKIEYELLHYLTTHPNSVYSRNDLLAAVWPNNGYVLDRTVDVTITRLRKKIGKYKDNLITKTGYGYYWAK